jgi:uncharacterized protein (TIGR03084 family)
VETASYAHDIDDLAAELSDLDELLATLTAAQWVAPTRCEGWDVADVVLHLAQTNEMAAASSNGTMAEWIASLSPPDRPFAGVDDAAAMRVEAERGGSADDIVGRWRRSCATMLATFSDGDASQRCEWVAGTLARRTLVTTRLAESWIHHGDVAEAVGRTLRPTARLRTIARLAWRTIPYSFEQAGRALAGPVALVLIGVDGDEWRFEPDVAATTTIRGSAIDWCAVAARRVPPNATGLRGEGPDADAVLALARTYAL